MKKVIKKYLTKFLLKYFNGSSKNYYYVRDHVKFYLFLRWLSEFVKNEEDIKHVLASIAHVMYNKGLNLPFTDIFVIENTVCICTIRPGLWIGKGGCIIDEITKEMNFNIEGEEIHNFKIHLMETTKGAVVAVRNCITILDEY